MVAQVNRSIMHPVQIVQGVSNAPYAYRSLVQWFDCINFVRAIEQADGCGGIFYPFFDYNKFCGFVLQNSLLDCSHCVCGGAFDSYINSDIQCQYKIDISKGASNEQKLIYNIGKLGYFLPKG